MGAHRWYQRFWTKRGQDIITNIDIDLQDIAEQALYKSIAHHDALGGTAIVMEVKTGAIKAMANLTKSENDIDEYYNYAVGMATEPGSTFKLATMMSLFEDGYISPEDQGKYKRRCSEPMIKEFENASDHIKYSNPTMKQVFAVSSNVGTADSKKNIMKGMKKFISRLRQFHLTSLPE